jgi:C-terminal processing protease CtpA/Prc
MLHLIGTTLLFAAPLAGAQQYQERPSQDPYDQQQQQQRTQPRSQQQSSRDYESRQGSQAQGDRAWLGVSLGEDDNRPGVRIDSVTPGSPAARIGLHSGDRLVAIDGRKVEDREDIVDILEQHGVGSRAEIRFVREIDVNLDEQQRTSDGRFALGVYMRSPRESGGRSLEVGSVTSNQPAGRAGIQVGDRIVSINGEELDDYDELQQAMRDVDRPGNVRVGIERTSTVALGSAVEASAPSGAGRPFEGSMREEDVQGLRTELQGLTREVRSLREELQQMRSEFRSYHEERQRMRDELREQMRDERYREDR